MDQNNNKNDLTCSELLLGVQRGDNEHLIIFTENFGKEWSLLNYKYIFINRYLSSDLRQLVWVLQHIN